MNYVINTGNLIQRILPKQADIDKMLKVIQRKVLKGTQLPAEIKDTGWIFKQLSFQGHLSEFGTK